VKAILLAWRRWKKRCSTEKKASFSYPLAPLKVSFAFRRRLIVWYIVLPQGCNSSPSAEDEVPQNEEQSRTTLDPSQKQH